MEGAGGSGSNSPGSGRGNDSRRGGRRGGGREANRGRDLNAYAAPFRLPRSNSESSILYVHENPPQMQYVFVPALTLHQPSVILRPLPPVTPPFQPPAEILEGRPQFDPQVQGQPYLQGASGYQFPGDSPANLAAHAVIISGSNRGRRGGERGVLQQVPPSLPRSRSESSLSVMSPTRPSGSFYEQRFNQLGHGASQWYRDHNLGGYQMTSQGQERPDSQFVSRRASTSRSNLSPSSSRTPKPAGAIHSGTFELLANFFKVQCGPKATIMKYGIEIDPEKQGKDRELRRLIFKEVVSRYRGQLGDRHAYDEGANLVYTSRDDLLGKCFNVNISGAYEPKEYKFWFKSEAKLEYSMIDEFLNGRELCDKTGDVFKGIDLLIKEKSSRDNEIDLEEVRAVRCFQQSLKCTVQGLALCSDYSVLPTRRPMSVIQFLEDEVEGFRDFNENEKTRELSQELRQKVENALKYLKVTATHRPSSKSFTIKGLSVEMTMDVKVTERGQSIELKDYFHAKYRMEISNLNLPCLNLGTKKKKNYLPMELCNLAKVQKHLGVNSNLVEYSRAKPMDRKKKICDWMRSGINGGGFLEQFGLRVETTMTKVEGRIIDLPLFKDDGNGNIIEVDQQRRKRPDKVVRGIPVNKWVLINFHGGETQPFVKSLRRECTKLGIELKKPLGTYERDFKDLSDASRVACMLNNVLTNTKLQLIICIMAEKHEGYKYIKWVSETKIGVITQCCLANDASRRNSNFLKNLALKINAKLGGTNIELYNLLPGSNEGDLIMLIGADVSHPGASNLTSPSIAAVAASIDKAMARYAARIRPQAHREEKIERFGEMVRELVEAYESENRAKPQKIIIFRDGVAESQFDKIQEELEDLRNTIFDGMYKAPITLVVAVKRHRTRLFMEGSDSNVPEGTVVDTVIVQPQQVWYNFYLCSHRGSLGTSKPTYYHVLCNENNLTLEQIEKLVYNICCTCARCRNSVSLVTPVYYAHLAASRGHAFREALVSKEDQELQSNYTLKKNVRDTMFFV